MRKNINNKITKHKVFNNYNVNILNLRLKKNQIKNISF